MEINHIVGDIVIDELNDMCSRAIYHSIVILCHEIDHLDGILYKDKAEEFFSNEPEEA